MGLCEGVTLLVAALGGGGEVEGRMVGLRGHSPVAEERCGSSSLALTLKWGRVGSAVIIGARISLQGFVGATWPAYD